MNKNSKGFTLIELLVVIGILAVLLAITLIAINPQRQFSQANNTKRSSDVNAILNAINQNMADNKGIAPAGINATIKTLTNDPALITAGTGVDICTALVTQYLAALPVDPQTNNGTPVTDCTIVLPPYNTNYTVVRNGIDNRITVAAPGAELTASISVTR